MPALEPLLQIDTLAKRYPGVLALDAVDFDVRAGEVHALMGQNGAGKSTLIKVLTGVTPRDAGTITLAGREFHATSPADAQCKGISTVYQEVNLVPTLSVAENLLLGREPRGWLGISWRKMRREAERLLRALGLRIGGTVGRSPSAAGPVLREAGAGDRSPVPSNIVPTAPLIDVAEPLGRYPVAIQQMVAIARALQFDARLLIFDEPTSSLDARETQTLFSLLRTLKSRGLGIIFVTHFLDQVYRIADRITILRNGALVGTYEAAALPKLDLIARMLGREPSRTVPSSVPRSSDRDRTEDSPAPTHDRGAVLIARDLGRRGALEPTDLTLHRGEILGLAGLLGSGRTELARLLFGADRASSGAVANPQSKIQNRKSKISSPRRAIAAGMALCPEDRKTDALFADMTVAENIAIVVQRRLSRFHFIARETHARIAERFVAALNIATPDVHRPVKFLSGGNQQKVMLARWLACQPRILLLDEPTRGIDIGAKAELEKLIDRLAREDGMAILFISAELDELVRRCDRIAVLRDRRKIGELTGDAISEAEIMNLIAGAP